MTPEREKKALLWADLIRTAADEAIEAVSPGCDKESVTGVKLQMLTRRHLAFEAEPLIRKAEHCEKEQAEEIRKDVLPMLIEELVPPLMPFEEQQELTLFLFSCFEGGESFSELFCEAVSGEPGADERLTQMAEALQEKAMSLLRDAAEERAEETKPAKPKRSGYVFPADYPYMDEFEYIDHCIAGDDDD